ncbi:DUF4412 domain-containing protein [Algoriphagus sp. AGSA1]|uniref:DUF4412 domain-containing protein n=1 Tax=Algoriphagus sp. AGSA1 TaxID=2907213 RepID=UPI001F3F154E|nr:DUF4412 domain-containing protein [Algoriphagus sp. AGSA1]MCE7055528.1 DUF4412 domain-containing protein [Algoriphagus sp. AGSA1]
MRSFTKYLFVILIFLGSSISSEAQFIKKIQNAANRGIENAIERKVEDEASKMTERQLEKMFSNMYGDDSLNARGIDMESIMKGLGEPVETESAYVFFGHIVMEMNSTDEKGKAQDPVMIKSYLTKTTDYSAMELVDSKNPKNSTAMVFDVKNQASVLFLDNKGEKSSFAYKLNLDNLDDMVDAHLDTMDINSDVILEKTGKSKDILGHSCEEYHVKTEDGEGYYWVTKDPIGGYTSFWGANSPMMTTKTQERYSKHFKDLPKGNFMEMTFTSTESGKINMKVIEIDESSEKMFTMQEYPNLMNSMQQN